MPQEKPWEKYQPQQAGPWTKYQKAPATAPNPGLPHDPMREGSATDVLKAQAREAAIGILEPFALQNLPEVASAVGGALYDMLTGKGSAKAQELVKGVVTAPIEPIKDLASGDPQRMAHGAGGFLSTTIPAITSAASGVKAGVAAAIPKNAATELYSGAVKTGLKTINTPIAEVQKLTQTGLKNAIPISEAGLAKLEGLINDLNNTVDTKIKGSTATVDKYKVTSKLNDTTKRFENQVNPEADLNAIAESGNEFLRNQPGQIPIEAAQEMKKGTYQQIKGRSFGELKSAQIEAQKALARGLKDEIANQIPELTDLNAKEGALIQLEDVIERAVNKDSNRRPSMGPYIVAGAAGAASGSGSIGVALGVLKRVLANPDVRTRLAIAINKAQQRFPQKYGAPDLKTAFARVTALESSLGSAATNPPLNEP